MSRSENNSSRDQNLSAHADRKLSEDSTHLPLVMPQGSEAPGAHLINEPLSRGKSISDVGVDVKVQGRTVLDTDASVKT